MKPPDLPCLLQFLEPSSITPCWKFTSHRSSILSTILMILPSPSHQITSLILGFLIFANFRRPALVYDLHLVQGSFLLSLSSRRQAGSGFNVLYTLPPYPFLIPFPFTTLNLEGLECLVADWVVSAITGCACSWRIQWLKVLDCWFVVHLPRFNFSLRIVEVIMVNGYLLTEIALWRLFPSSDSGKKNDDNSGFFNPFS